MLELIIFILIGAYLVNYVHQKELKNKQEKYYVYDEEGNEIDVRETVLPSNIVKEKNEQSKSDDKK